MNRWGAVIIFLSVISVSSSVLGQEIYKEYWPSGHIKSEEPIVDGKRDGLASYYHDNGQMYGQIPWVNGEREGQFRLYRADGTLEQELSYKAGQTNGVCRWFDEQGRLKEEAPYVNGRIDGEVVWYNPDGSVAQRVMYRNDQPISQPGQAVKRRSTKRSSDDTWQRLLFYLIVVPLVIFFKSVEKKKKVLGTEGRRGTQMTTTVAANLSALPPAQRFEQLFRVTVLIAGSMIIAVFFLGVLLYATYGPPDMSNPLGQSDNCEILRNIFLCYAFILIFSIPRITDFLLNKETVGHNASLARDPFTEMNKLVGAAIVKLALSETPALLGLMLAVLSNRVSDYYLLAVFSLVSFILNFPRYDQWEQWIKQRIPGIALNK